MQRYFRKQSKLALEVFEKHLAVISPYLNYQDKLVLKQVCRATYYNLITIDLWNTLKSEVAFLKLQDIDDDLEFQDQPVEKADKNTRKIRIHSLNKRMLVQEQRPHVITPTQSALRSVAPLANNPPTLLMPRASQKSTTRFLSSSKKDLMNSTNSSTQINNLSTNSSSTSLFMKTELGFKRLGGLNKTQQLHNLLDIPDKLQLVGMQIRLNDAMDKNIERARMIGQVIGRWIDYHRKICADTYSKTELEPLDRTSSLCAYLGEKESLCKEYQRRFALTPYKQLLANAEKAIAIDDVLQKKLKVFHEQHALIMKVDSSGFEDAKNTAKKIDEYLKKPAQDRKQDNIHIFQRLQTTVQSFITLVDKLPGIVIPISLSFMDAVDVKLQNLLQSYEFTLRKIAALSEETSVLLDTTLSILEKGIGLLSKCEGKVRQSSMLTKWKAWQGCCSQLIKMCRYFSKVKTQLRNKEKQQGKKDPGPIVVSIREFVQKYQKIEQNYVVFRGKQSQERLQKDFEMFKQDVQDLKKSIK